MFQFCGWGRLWSKVGERERERERVGKVEICMKEVTCECGKSECLEVGCISCLGISSTCSWGVFYSKFGKLASSGLLRREENEVGQ